jgi:hypothetical protein
MRLWLNIAVLTFVFVLFSLVGCQKEEIPPAETKASGLVLANQAYLDNFGSPPQGKAGEAFARVGYLPLQNTPGKVRAFPLFLFSDKGELRQILERLVSGELQLPEGSGFFNPFPDDFTVEATALIKPTVTLSLTAHQAWPVAGMVAAGLALAETVFQFPQVEHVFMTLNDQPMPQMPAGGYLRSPEKLDTVMPPSIVLMAGMWEKGTDNLDELLVEFDRPITVNNFKLYNNSGEAIEGEYFTSIFQMAVVVLPKDPTLYQEATMLRADWDVVDGLGRSNSGSTTMPLRRYEH